MFANMLKKKAKIFLFFIISIIAILFFFIAKEKNLLSLLFAYIESLEELLKTTLKDVQYSRNIFGLSIFWLISFLYGFLHAAGPGHGKTVVTAYLFSERSSYKEGFILAATLATTHISISVFLSYLFMLVINNITLLFDTSFHLYFKAISGGMLILIGAVLLVKKFIRRRNEIQEEIVEKKTFSSPTIVGFLTGIMPCPATIFIMTFALGAQMPFVGLFASTGILFGVFVLISLLSVLVIRSRDGIEYYVGRKYVKGLERASLVMGYISSTIIILIGLLVLLSTLR